MKRPATLGALTATVALALAGAGCARDPVPPAPVGAAQRIAVMAPAAAETLAQLGEAARIVAVGDFVDQPPGVRSLPRLGAYDAPSPERLIELGVDLLLTTAGSAGASERSALAGLGIRVVALDTATFAGTLAAIAEIGRLVDRESAASELIDGIERRVGAVRTQATGLPRRRVLVVVGRDPLFVAGPGSYLDELITIAGGENLAGDALAPFAMVSLEAMLERRPEVILESADNRLSGPFGAIAGDWQRWDFLPAVAAGRVFRLEPSRLLVPGPRLGEMAERMARLIHPERFGPPRAEDFAPPPANREGAS